MQSGAECELPAVIIEGLGEVVVALGLEAVDLTGGAGGREHCGHLSGLRVGAVLALRLGVGHEVVRVDDLARALQLVVHQVVGGADVPARECALVGAVAEEEVALLSLLVLVDVVVVVLELLFGLKIN